MTARVFEVNDCEWWAGDCSPAELLEAYMKETGVSREDATGDDGALPRALSDEEMDSLKFKYDDETGPIDPPRTFREELADMIRTGVQFPCFFATTEY